MKGKDFIIRDDSGMYAIQVFSNPNNKKYIMGWTDKKNCTHYTTKKSLRIDCSKLHAQGWINFKYEDTFKKNQRPC